MKQKVIEPVLGICLLAMVVMAVKYGSIHVTGSGDAYIKETPVVVVDAGHGGTDPGKVGVDGSLEKDIHLAVAERLKTYLEQDDVKVIIKHALRNALLPVVTYIGPMFAALITGSFVVEKVFGIPGIGNLFTNSILNRDYTLIMGITVFFSVILVICILVVDILYVLIDPRIKYQ